MENGRKLLRGIALAAIAVIGLGGIALFASPSLAAQTRPDVIRIDAIGQLKKLEMPPAVFLHDEHTKALAATGQDCSVCHTPTANGHTVKFQRKEDGTDAKKLENIYHNGCIGCHENMASNNQKTGPLDGECRACHDTKLPFKAEQKPVKMGSKSLHYLHVSSKAIVNPANSEENCGVCHHVYDEKLNKLVWKKGQEDACAACHGEKAVGSTPSLQTAVHTKCVWCHENVAQSSRAYLTAQVEAKKAAEPKSTKKLSAKEVQAEAAAESEPGEAKGLDDLTDVTPAGSNARLGEHASEVHAQRELQYDIKYPYDLSHEKVSEGDRRLAEAMTMVADGPALAVLKDIYRRQDVLELVGVHSHIGSNIHDADAFIQAAKRMMLLRKTFYATDAYTLPEVDLGGGYSVAYTDGEDSMDIDVELGRLADAVSTVNRALGMPAPVISFEPGRWTVAPTGVTLYRVGTVKPVELSGEAKDKSGNPVTERVYVSVDGGMSDNIRPALYGSDYTARLANRKGSEQTKLCRVVGMHCESGDIVVNEVRLPADIKRGDILAVPVTGAYGRTMASNYNQALIPAVVGVGEAGAHVMIRRQTIDDLLSWDVSE